MVSFRILAGGYDTFVATYLFTTGSNTLELLGRTTTGINPSWLTYHPSNKGLVYVTNEYWAGGSLQLFSLNSNGLLSSSALDTISAGGNSPVHILPLSNGRAVVAANYESGSAKVVNINPGGTFVRSQGSEQVITFPRPTTGQSRPHQAYEYGNEVLIPDLGADTIWRLVPTNSTGNGGLYQIAGQLPQARGSGPRHVQVYNDRLFLVHELSGEVSLQNIPSLPSNQTSIISKVPTYPPDGPSNPRWAAAEIYIPPPTARFPVPYVYVSNRNKGSIKDPRGDSIAIYEHVNKGTNQEGLRLVKHAFTGLDGIRGFEFGGDENEYIVAGASETRGGGVVILQRVDEGRDLRVVVRNTAIANRLTFLWA